MNRMIKGIINVNFIALVSIVILIVFILGLYFFSNKLTDKTTKKVVSVIKEETIRKSLSKEGETAYQTLLITSVFEDKYLGYSGRPSEMVKAFKQILLEKQANEIFKDILEKGKPAGKLYALCGLYLTDLDYFHKVIGQYKDNEQEVNTFWGCVISKIKFSDIVKSKPQVLITVPSAKKRSSLLKNSYPIKVSYYEPQDILSGYFPKRFGN